jgi:hypothetical protein
MEHGKPVSLPSGAGRPIGRTRHCQQPSFPHDSNIIGATSLAQLEENIGSIDVRLGAAVLDEIEAAHKRAPVSLPVA